MKKYTFFVAMAALFALTSCEKVSPIGVLVSGTGVEDRVEMSRLFYQEHKGDYQIGYADGTGDYTFLVGGDSHVTTDVGRMDEMQQSFLDNEDMFMAHLGDIADTKAEYYINLENSIQKYKRKYADKYYQKFSDVDSEYDDGDDNPLYIDPGDSMLVSLDDIIYPFFPVVGNHDLTHNGWALWCNIFHSSFYSFDIYVEATDEFDHFIFLDTASGTLGQKQVDLIEEGMLDGDMFGRKYRHTFVFSHTNIFRPSSLQFASTFAREETFFLLNQFRVWDASIVFCGHVHKWDEQTVDGVHYLTLDSMSERNNPEPGNYLLRVHVKANGELSWEHVRMNYTAK